MKSDDIGERRAHQRHSLQLEVSISLKNPFSRIIGPLNKGLTLVGRTKNISEGGIAVVVSASNIDRYLKRKALPIEIRLSLPEGVVVLQATPIHFTRFSSPEGAVTYLIGTAFVASDSLAVLRTFLGSFPLV